MCVLQKPNDDVALALGRLTLTEIVNVRQLNQLAQELAVTTAERDVLKEAAGVSPTDEPAPADDVPA